MKTITIDFDLYQSELRRARYRCQSDTVRILLEILNEPDKGKAKKMAVDFCDDCEWTHEVGNLMKKLGFEFRGKV